MRPMGQDHLARQLAILAERPRVASPTLVLVRRLRLLAFQLRPLHGLATRLDTLVQQRFPGRIHNADDAALRAPALDSVFENGEAAPAFPPTSARFDLLSGVRALWVRAQFHQAVGAGDVLGYGVGVEGACGGGGGRFIRCGRHASELND